MYVFFLTNLHVGPYKIYYDNFYIIYIGSNILHRPKYQRDLSINIGPTYHTLRIALYFVQRLELLLGGGPR